MQLRALATLVIAFVVFVLTGCRWDEVQNVYLPEGVVDTTQLVQRMNDQLADTARLDVLHDFSFSDRVEESGIDFQHKIVDDAGYAYKMIHYDHGNGLSIADVDGDGRSDIYFVNQIGSNELWRNRGDGTFENMTEGAGVGMDDVVSVAAAFADIDNDGDQDLYVTTVRYGNCLFENDGSGAFTDISETSGLQFSGHSSGAVFFDYDRDGLLDLFLTNVGEYTTGDEVPVQGRTRFDDLEGEYSYYVGYGDSTMGKLIPERDEPNLLFRNEGDNRFVDVSEEMGITELANRGWSGDVAAWDVNEDGWTDLYVLDMNGDDDYLENVGGERFVWKTPEVFPSTPFGSMGVTVFDYDNDGRMDLYLTDMHSDMFENSYVSPYQEKQKPDEVLPVPKDTTGTKLNIFGNALFRNDGVLSFTDVTGNTHTETYWPWGVSSGDLNADGYDDLFVTGSMNYPFRYGVNSLLLNDRGQGFVDSEFILGVEPRRDRRTAKVWFVVDCASEEHEICEETGATGQVDVWGALGSRSSVLFDLDDDGDLDIVTNEFNDGPMVLVSDLSDRNPDLRFAKVKLVGTTSNRDGLGATVRLHTGPTTLTRVYNGQSGYLSHSTYPLYFGLGSAETIDRIEVEWPSGRTQVVEGPLPVNQRIAIEER